MKGLGTALITPFTTAGAVDYEALERLLETQIGAVDYIVVLGTTGEAATLSEEEQQTVREFIVRKVNGRLPLVLGLGGNCTQAVINKLQHIDLTPFAAILSVCPYYNKPTQEGLYQHFKAIAEVSSVPVILYNVPGRTGVNLLPETVKRLVDSCGEWIMGIKEASGNMVQIKELISLVGNRLHVILGDDGLAAEGMAAGADGLISVASNLYPADFHAIVHNTEDRAAELQERYAAFVNLIFREGNPVGIKSAMAIEGICKPAVRLPLVEASNSLQADLTAQINAFPAQK